LELYVTAEEWNRLVKAVNSVTSSSVTEVKSGDKITASSFNALASALGMSTTVTKDKTQISADLLN
jgi:hypothetical protein